MDLDKIQFKKFFPIFIFLNCQIKLKIFFLLIYQVGTNCEPDVDRVRLGEQNTYEECPISRARIRYANFQSNL